MSLLKQKVEDREGIPPAEQRLLWQGRELVNSSTLAECSLGEGDCFRVVLRVCGGAPKKKKKVAATLKKRTSCRLLSSAIPRTPACVPRNGTLLMTF